MLQSQQYRSAAVQGFAITIHCTPKRSVSIAKAGEKNVLPSGMKTLPPRESASNLARASSGFAAVSESENPCMPLCDPGGESDAITTESSTRKAAYITFSP